MHFVEHRTIWKSCGFSHIFVLQAERMYHQGKYDTIKECFKVFMENNVLPDIYTEEIWFDKESTLPDWDIFLEMVEAGYKLAKDEDIKTMEPDEFDKTMEAEEFEEEVDKLTELASYRDMLKAMFHGICGHFSLVWQDVCEVPLHTCAVTLLSVFRGEQQRVLKLKKRVDD